MVSRCPVRLNTACGFRQNRGAWRDFRSSPNLKWVGSTSPSFREPAVRPSRER